MTLARSLLSMKWLLLAAIALAGASGIAPADDYPTRTIRAVVPFAPAGVMDVVVRIVLEKVGQSLGQQIIIDNRPGAGGTMPLIPWRMRPGQDAARIRCACEKPAG